MLNPSLVDFDTFSFANRKAEWHQARASKFHLFHWTFARKQKAYDDNNTALSCVTHKCSSTWVTFPHVPNTMQFSIQLTFSGWDYFYQPQVQ
jgi:hypothetical protein